MWIDLREMPKVLAQKKDKGPQDNLSIYSATFQSGRKIIFTWHNNNKSVSKSFWLKMQRSRKKMQIFSHKKSSWVVCPQILFFWHWNRAMNAQVWETELVTTYWCKYFNFFPKWIHSPLEAGLALVKKLSPKIWVISQHELYFLWKEGRGKNHTSPNKKRGHGLKLWVNSKHFIFWEGSGKM